MLAGLLLVVLGWTAAWSLIALMRQSEGVEGVASAKSPAAALLVAWAWAWGPFVGAYWLYRRARVACRR